jgi:uncharacterized membrane protein YuzA (DUF378 family)
MLKQACILCKIAGAIAIIGALNWGLVGIAQVNLIDFLFGAGSATARIIYIFVGLSGIALLGSFFKSCPLCDKRHK